MKAGKRLVMVYAMAVLLPLDLAFAAPGDVNHLSEAYSCFEMHFRAALQIHYNYLAFMHDD